LANFYVITFKKFYSGYTNITDKQMNDLPWHHGALQNIAQ